jgi:hypothetical protein
MNASRGLTPGEIALAHSVFGDAIDYDRVRIHAKTWWPFQHRRMAMAPNGHLYLSPKGPLWCDDFCERSITRQGLFIHEMTHVWQHQQGVNLILKRHPFCRYDYTIKPGWPLERYGIEQQAEIVRHAFELARGEIVPGAPGLDVYRGVLPFGATSDRARP